MKLGVLFAFQGSPDYYRSFFFSELLCLFSKRLSYVVCSHNYIFSALTKLASLENSLSNFYFYILVILLYVLRDIFQWDGLTTCP